MVNSATQAISTARKPKMVPNMPVIWPYCGCSVAKSCTASGWLRSVVANNCRSRSLAAGICAVCRSCSTMAVTIGSPWPYTSCCA